MEYAVSIAADQAIFYYQYPTQQAIKYVCRQVPGCSPEAAQVALRRSATFHQ